MLDMFFLAQTQGNEQALQATENNTQTQVSTEQGNEPVGGTGAGTGANNPDAMMQMLLMLGIVAVLYFIMFRGPQKKEKERKRMLSEVKKNDKVRTIGGIIATVVEVRDKEVILKIDESNNTRIKVIREAIGEILTEQQ